MPFFLQHRSSLTLFPAEHKRYRTIQQITQRIQPAYLLQQWHWHLHEDNFGVLGILVVPGIRHH